MKNTAIRKILKRYLQGNASAQEQAAVDRWYDSFTPQSKHALHNTAHKEEVWQHIEMARITGTNQGVFTYWRIAASFAVLAIISGVLWLALPSRNQPERYATLTTGTGQQKKFVLQDSSILTLNSNSHVQVAEDFTRTRKVNLLEGEVFFDVARDKARPFIIQTGTLQTHVLGTSFNIQAYPETGIIRVSVVTGNVRVLQPDVFSEALLPEQQLSYRLKDSVHTLSTGLPAALAWREGRLVLQDETFAGMAALMKRQYGITVVAAQPELRDVHFTTTLRPGLTARQAMEILAAIHNLNIHSKNDTLMLSH